MYRFTTGVAQFGRSSLDIPMARQQLLSQHHFSLGSIRGCQALNRFDNLLQEIMSSSSSSSSNS